MTLKLTLKNIQKSFKDYTIYFFTLILGVSIFYLFNSLESQSALLKLTSSQTEIIELLVKILNVVSVGVSFVLGGLIVYASRFLIKRRKKEFGIYFTLGMSKRKMSLILFIETLCIGLLSLVAGMIIGVFLSQFMSILVAKLFRADMTRFTFIFSTSACLKTVLYFGVMYLIVILFNTISINRYQLIDLIYGSKKHEVFIQKNNILCTIVFIVSSVALGFAYYYVAFSKDDMMSYDLIIIAIITGIITTILIFWSLSGILINIFTHIKSFYYKGLNSFTLKQFSNKINTMTLSMSVICLLLFMTICLLGSGFSLTQYVNSSIEYLTPVDVSVVNYGNERKTTELLDNKLKSQLKDITYVSYYRGTQEYVGNTYMDYTFMSISDYDKVAKLYGYKQFSLKSNEYAILCDSTDFINDRNELLEKNTSITVNNQSFTPKYKKCIKGFVELQNGSYNPGIIILPDKVLSGYTVDRDMVLANYNGDKEEIEKMLDTYKSMSNISVDTSMRVETNNIGIGALFTFICLYLGVIFLITSAAILALKELSDSTDNTEQYGVLESIGTDKNMMNHALLKQIGIFFIFPLLIACIHSIFGLKFALRVFESFGYLSLTRPLLLTSLIILLIYGGYFLFTYMSCKSIIHKRN